MTFLFLSFIDFAVKVEKSLYPAFAQVEAISQKTILRASSLVFNCGYFTTVKCMAWRIENETQAA